LILTGNGRAELVVLDAETYQELIDKIEFAESVKDLKEGIESFERGEGRPAREALDELAKKHGILS
jgi:PHD/YefM family antitoxin component YafN of YafNO toxin-antitoxin module